jgi:hypothetical protein
MKYITIAALPLCAGLLFAQQQSRIETRTTSTKSTWNGTLVDAACQSTRTERKESRDADNNRTVTTTTRTEIVDCPVTTTTTTFGLLTADGRYVKFDNLSNARVVEIVKRDKTLDTYLTNRTPLHVKVVGTANGDVAVVDSLDPAVGATSVLTAQTVTQTQEDVIFDVRHKGDRGKLVITARGVSFEDLSDAKHSRTWNYSQIRELKREGRNEVKIEPFSGDSYEFKLEGRALSDSLYRMIGDRIVAARSR